MVGTAEFPSPFSFSLWSLLYSLTPLKITAVQRELLNLTSAELCNWQVPVQTVFEKMSARLNAGDSFWLRNFSYWRTETLLCSCPLWRLTRKMTHCTCLLSLLIHVHHSIMRSRVVCFLNFTLEAFTFRPSNILKTKYQTKEEKEIIVHATKFFCLWFQNCCKRSRRMWGKRIRVLW